jgi:hypothetical protein
VNASGTAFRRTHAIDATLAPEVDSVKRKAGTNAGQIFPLGRCGETVYLARAQIFRNRRFSMKTSLAAILSILALLPSAPAVSAQSTAYHCILYTKNAGKDVRFSSAPVLTTADAATLNAAWKRYVVATYHVSDPNAYGGCQAVSGTLAQREMVVTTGENNYKKLGAEVVHVEWTSAPGQTAQAPTPSPERTQEPAAPAKPPAAPAPPARPAAPTNVPAPAAPPASAAAPVAPVFASPDGGRFIQCATSGGPEWTPI